MYTLSGNRVAILAYLGTIYLAHFGILETLPCHGCHGNSPHGCHGNLATGFTETLPRVSRKIFPRVSRKRSHECHGNFSTGVTETCPRVDANVIYIPAPSSGYTQKVIIKFFQIFNNYPRQPYPKMYYILAAG
jgi:hypothetical protein